jgi:dienelactone hydrolase
MAIDGFGPALDGHYDVADAVRRYLDDRTGRRLAAARETRAALDTRGDHERRRDRLRERFLDRIGGLPERGEDPTVETTDVLEREGYTVERLVVERHPGVHLTANCYVPDGASEGAPRPGALFLCGHVAAGKADPLNQRACIELATSGVVVLAVDAVSQGERGQYRDAEIGARPVGGGVTEHCYAGQQCLYAGATLARYVLDDDRSALTALAGRGDVDAERLGVVGTSGGGVRTQYLGFVDDRVAVAAPCCSVTTRAEWLKTGKRVDAEQLVPGAAAVGLGHAEFLAAMAPRPVLVGAATSDQYFPVEGAHEAVGRARRVYGLYDARDAVDLVVADRPHCSVYEFGDELFEWLCDRLGAGPFVPREDHAVVEPGALDATPEGDVRSSFPDERTVTDRLAADLAAGRVGPEGDERGDEGTANGGSVDPDGLRDRLVERFGLDRPVADRHPRTTHRGGEGDLDVERLWFRTERDPDAVVAGVLVSDPESRARSPAVVCFADGTRELPARSDDVAALAAEHGAVLVFDPRGVGATRNRTIPVPAWVEDDDGVYGTAFKLAYDALALDDSLFGLRVFDVLQGAAFLRARTDARRVSFVGEGVGAYHALYAAGATGAVGRVDLRALGPGFREMATSREYPYDARLTAYDVLDSDVPDVLAALRERGTAVERAPE